MEIVNLNTVPLSNFEVMRALMNTKDTKKKFGLRNLATITYETLQYLENTPAKGQTEQNIINFLTEIKPFNLTKNECLMIINDPPTSPLHIQLLIKDSEERLTDEQVQTVLEIASRTLLSNNQT